MSWIQTLFYFPARACPLEDHATKERMLETIQQTRERLAQLERAAAARDLRKPFYRGQKSTGD